MKIKNEILEKEKEYIKTIYMNEIRFKNSTVKDLKKDYKNEIISIVRFGILNIFISFMVAIKTFFEIKEGNDTISIIFWSFLLVSNLFLYYKYADIIEILIKLKYRFKKRDIKKLKNFFNKKEIIKKRKISFLEEGKEELYIEIEFIKIQSELQKTINDKKELFDFIYNLEYKIKENKVKIESNISFLIFNEDELIFIKNKDKEKKKTLKIIYKDKKMKIDEKDIYYKVDLNNYKNQKLGV